MLQDDTPAPPGAGTRGRRDDPDGDDTMPEIPTETPFNEAKRDALAHALRERFSMSHEDALETATVVAQQFGEHEEVNDETLDPNVRSIFYTLEAKKILSFRREEYSIESGERRRGFWWRLREEELRRMTTVPVKAADEDVYATLPQSIWSARQNA
jgi:hypothetical protein